MLAPSSGFDAHQAIPRVWWYHGETQAFSKFISLIYSGIFLKNMFIFILLCVDVLPACLSVHHLLACCHCKTDKVSDSLDLELNMTVGGHLGAGN